MKIALVTETLSTHSGSRAPVEVAKGLAKLGNTVVVLALYKNSDLKLKKELKKLGIQTILFSQHKLIASGKLFWVLKKLKPEIISFSATLPFFLASKLSGFPIVKTFYGTQLDAYFEKTFPRKSAFTDKFLNFLANKLIIAIEKIQFISSSEVIAISKFSAKQAQKFYNTKIKYCYLGASNLGKVEPIDTPKRNFILSVSRFTPYKGFHELIKATGDFPLIIVGSQGSKKYLSYLKRIKGVNCQILINIEDNKLSYLYKNCLFYASFDKYPFFGLPIVEAASFSKPTISQNFGAVGELIENGKTGFIVKDIKEFQKYAQFFFKNPKLCQKMGSAARQRVSKLFNWKNTTHYYSKIFQQVLAKKTKKNPTFWLFLLIFLTGLMLRILFLNHHDFWFDEAFSYFVAKQNLINLIQATAADNNPPLYFLLLHFWLKILGETETAQRFLSTIFGVLTIGAIYLLGKFLFDQKTGLVAALIAALSPLFIYFSVETRMYTQITFLALFSTFFFLKWLKNQKNAAALGFIITLVAGFYTNYYSFLLLIPFTLITLKEKNRSLALKFILLEAISLTTFLPWLVIYFQNPHPQIFSQQTPIALLATFASFILGGTGIVTLRQFFQLEVGIPIIFIFTLSLIFFAIIFLTGLLKFKKGNNLKNLVIFLASPLILLTIANFFWPIFSVRGTILLAPYYYLVTARALSGLKPKLFYPAVWAIILSLAVINFIHLYNPAFKGPQLKKAASLVGSSSVVHTSILTYYPFTYYHDDKNFDFLIGESPLTYKTQSLIETKVKKIDELPEQITLVEIKNGNDPIKLGKLKNQLLDEFQIKKIEKFGEITLTNLEK